MFEKQNSGLEKGTASKSDTSAKFDQESKAYQNPIIESNGSMMESFELDEIGKVDAKHDELANDVKDLGESMMEHFEFQETRLEKVEEEAMRIKMNEEMIESYDRIWFFGKGF